MYAIEQPTRYFETHQTIELSLIECDRLELQAAKDLLAMRNEKLYKEENFRNFEEYCEIKLARFGGYRRINQLLGLVLVREAAGEFEDFVKNERQARPLLRLLKTPEKIKQAIALVTDAGIEPSAIAFKAAVDEINPPIVNNSLQSQEPMVPQIDGSERENQGSSEISGTNGSSNQAEEQMVPQKVKTPLHKFRVSNGNHYRAGQVGTVCSRPNLYSAIVEFEDGSRETIANNNLEEVVVAPQRLNRNWSSAEHYEAIALIEEAHKRELEAMEREIMARLSGEFQEKALASVTAELAASREQTANYKKQNLNLHQQVEDLESLRSLKFENEMLVERVATLERALEERSFQQWDKTFSESAEKVVRANEDKLNLKKLVAAAPPNLSEEVAIELVQMFGLALANIAIALPNPSPYILKSVGEILRCEPTTHAVGLSARAVHAVREITTVLSRSSVAWLDFWGVAQRYEDIKSVYWKLLSGEQKELVKALKNKYELISKQSNTVV